MAVNYGIHQEGDQYIINPRLVNGDGFIGLGSEVKVHIVAGNNNDVLTTPKLQVTSGAETGKVLKAIDNQGNMAWSDDLSFSPYTVKNIFVSFDYIGEATAIESFDGSEATVTLQHLANNAPQNLRVYLGTDSAQTEEIPVADYNVATVGEVSTITFTEALGSAFIVVYSYEATQTVTDFPIPVTGKIVNLPQTVSANLVVKDGSGQEARTFVLNTDYTVVDNNKLSFIPSGAIVGLTQENKYLLIGNDGDTHLAPLGLPDTFFEQGYPDSLTVSYRVSTDVENEQGTAVTAEDVTTYTVATTSASGFSLERVESISVGGTPLAQNAYRFNPQTGVITFNETPASTAVEVSYRYSNEYLNQNVSVSNGVAALTVPSGTNSMVSTILAISYVDDESQTRYPRLGQDFIITNIPEESRHEITLLNQPAEGQILMKAFNGNNFWEAPAQLIKNYTGESAEGKVVTYQNGELVFSDSAALVELEDLVPDPKIDSYILKWNGAQQQVIWAADNDSWPAVVDNISAPGLFLVSQMNGDIKSVQWTDTIALPADQNFSLSTFGTGIVSLDSGKHVVVTSTGNAEGDGIDLIASNSNDTSGGDIGLKAYDSVYVETVTGNVELSAKDAVAISTGDQTTQNAGNVSITSGATSGTANAGSIVLSSGTTSGAGSAGDIKLLVGGTSGAGAAGSLKIQLPGAAPEVGMVLCVDSVDANGVATLTWRTVDSLVMTSGH